MGQQRILERIPSGVQVLAPLRSVVKYKIEDYGTLCVCALAIARDLARRILEDSLGRVAASNLRSGSRTRRFSQVRERVNERRFYDQSIGNSTDYSEPPPPPSSLLEDSPSPTKTSINADMERDVAGRKGGGVETENKT